MKLVIIGGDAAGMSAASEARRRNPEAEIIVLEATEDVSYGACGLPYKLLEGADVEDLSVISAERFRQERDIDLRLGHRVDRLQPDRHLLSGTARGEPFTLDYDRLVIATGARALCPAIEGLDSLWGQGAYTLKTLEDGRVLKRALADKPASAAVIGGGYIGLEATENLRELGLQVTLIEALADLVPFLPPSQRERVRQEALRHEVDLRTSATVVRIGRRASGGLEIETTGDPVTADLVLVAVGVRPNAELAAEAGLTLGAGGSIAVDERLFTSAPDVLAAGDCADATHVLTGQSVWIPLALRANRAGKLAGQNAVSESTAKAPPVLGTAVFKFFDLQIARTGLSEAEARDAGFAPVSTDVVANTRAHYYPGGGKLSVSLVADRPTGRLLGGAMVGPEGAAHRIDTVVASLHAGLTAEQLYDMDLAYAPPFGPSWSPLLIAASKLRKAMS